MRRTDPKPRRASDGRCRRGRMSHGSEPGARSLLDRGRETRRKGAPRPGGGRLGGVFGPGPGVRGGAEDARRSFDARFAPD